MKKYILAAAGFMIVTFATAQNGPLNGSGRVLLKNFSYRDFDKLHLFDLAGKVDVSIDTAYSIAITIDDNLEKLLQVSNKNHTLAIGLKGNHQNRLYIENTNISIKITLPLIAAVKQNGNNSLYVNNINGKSLHVKCTGNGEVHLSGALEELSIVCAGNGNVNAAQLTAKSVQVTKRGNANVTINADCKFTAHGSGNGSVINTGKAIAEKNSGISGNGSIQYKASNSTTDDSARQVIKKTRLVTVILKNTSSTPANLIVKYPEGGSYGIEVPAMDTISQSFPAGTKVYYAGRIRMVTKPLFIVAQSNEGDTFIVK